MCKTDDGFAIAEADLRERKSGELTGVKQSGRNKIVDEMILISVCSTKPLKKSRTALDTRGERLRCFEFDEMAGI